MKVLVIPDLHGKSIWKDIIKKEFDNIDKIVFLGDYFDSFTIKGNEQIENFKNILKFKNKNRSKVDLLIGNHDYHYINTKEKYSGFQYVYADQIGQLLLKNLDLFKICVEYENTFYSHAGISDMWLDRNGFDDIDCEKINNLFENDMAEFGFIYKMGADFTGDNNYQGPLWIRPSSLKNYTKETQIVGHTMSYNITVHNTVTVTDCLDSVNNYLIVDNGEQIINNLN